MPPKHNYNQMLEELADDYLAEMTIWLAAHPEDADKEFLLEEEAYSLAEEKTEIYLQTLHKLPKSHIQNLYNTMLEEHLMDDPD